MKHILRVLLGIVGALGVAVALGLWIAPNEIAAQLGVAAKSALGVATIRADMAGFFGGAGAFALAAAIRDRAQFLTAPLLFIGLALAGRLVTVAVQGASADMIQPMAIEAILLALFATGRKALRA